MARLLIITTPGRSGWTMLLLVVTLLSHLTTTLTAGTMTPQELLRGFSAQCNVDSSTSSFQTLLSDSVGNYSLGFLQVNKNQLALAVIHVPSEEPLWIASTNRLARWSDRTRISFNGSLVISDPHTGLFWSSYTDGDRVRISNTSNLLIEKVNTSVSVLWQSFQFPYDTLMENQNFTNAMTLVSSNGRYSMKLGSNFIGFYAKFNVDSNSDPDSGQIYLKHHPLEAKARVFEGQGPIRIVLNSDGYLGMYQNGSTPVDVQPFSSFQQPGSGNRRIRLEPDGNLIGYFWTGSSWVTDFKQISDPCELPSACGSYGLCQPGKGCSCLDNRTEYNSGHCDIPGNQKEDSGGDFCGLIDRNYRVLRTYGVQLPQKEIKAYTIKSSLEKCESSCEEVCTCWGVVYSNTSGFGYTIDYPIQTLVGVQDETKMGYFKLKEGSGKKKLVVWLVVGIGSSCGAILLFLGVMWMFWKRSAREKRSYVEEEGVGEGVGPYTDLGSDNLKSIELS
ncbi:hypothetical protein L2E82_04190 [Cichorium intybus]|uniref:Uncharacterized protein n=1 Tax=Cichorium intybus TaxID=13427 RepID=A0ACB9H5P4_CICIN|nr:hypothetical protein L2E82_04190 [Cichorium intybus]